MSTKDRECTINAAKIVFGEKMSFLDNIAVVTMGHLCRHCKVMDLSLSVLPGDRH